MPQHVHFTSYPTGLSNDVPVPEWGDGDDGDSFSACIDRDKRNKVEYIDEREAGAVVAIFFADECDAEKDGTVDQAVIIRDVSDNVALSKISPSRNVFYFWGLSLFHVCMQLKVIFRSDLVAAFAVNAQSLCWVCFSLIRKLCLWIDSKIFCFPVIILFDRSFSIPRVAA